MRYSNVAYKRNAYMRAWRNARRHLLAYSGNDRENGDAANIANDN